METKTLNNLQILPYKKSSKKFNYTVISIVCKYRYTELGTEITKIENTTNMVILYKKSKSGYDGFDTLTLVKMN